MATEQQLIDALVRADRAGATEDAKVLAEALRNLRASKKPKKEPYGPGTTSLAPSFGQLEQRRQEIFGAAPRTPPQQPKPPTRLQAAAGQFAQSATLGQAPKIAAAVTGAGKEGEEFYRRKLVAGQEQYPVTTAAADIAGFLAPGGLAAGAVARALPVARTLPTALNYLARVGQGAAIGAAEGALYGSTVEAERQAMQRGQGSPTLQQRGEAAVLPTVLGAGIGGALPAVAIPAARALGPSVSAGIARARETLGARGAVERQAQRQGAKAVRADLERAGIRTLEDFQKVAAQYSGKPIMTAELAQSMTNTLTALTRGKGTTADNVSAILADRVAGFPARMMQDLEDATGLKPDEILGNIEELVKEGRRAAAPLYKAAEQAGFEVSPRLQRLMENSPLAQRAMDDAMQTLRNEAAAKDIAIDEIPVLRLYDEVKKNLDDLERTARRSADPAVQREARSVESVRQALVEELDKIVPGAYAAARKAGGEAPKLESARKSGAKALAKPLNVVSQEFGALDDLTKQSYRGAFVMEIADMINKGRLKPNALRSPNLMQKMTLLFGEENANRLATKLTQEFDMMKRAARFDPNVGSVTSQAILGKPDQELDDILTGATDAINLFQQIAAGNIPGIATRVLNFFRRQGYNERQLNEIGNILISDPEDAARILFPKEAARMQGGGTAGANILAQPENPTQGSGAPVKNALTSPSVSGTPARMGIGSEGRSQTIQKAQAEGYKGADIGEAKEWVAARKKGLDMSQAARLQRAREMGFNTNTPFYHGSANENIQAFKSNQSETGEGIFLTDNPFVAEEYSNVKDLMSLDELPVGATNQQGFYDLYVRGKFKPIDVKGAHFSQVNMRKEIAAAKAEGFDGIDFQNINDAKYSKSMSGTTRVVFDPRNIRSINAAFDPEETGSANILAGLGTGAAGVTAASMAGEGNRS